MDAARVRRGGACFSNHTHARRWIRRVLTTTATGPRATPLRNRLLERMLLMLLIMLLLLLIMMMMCGIMFSLTATRRIRWTAATTRRMRRRIMLMINTTIHTRHTATSVPRVSRVRTHRPSG